MSISPGPMLKLLKRTWRHFFPGCFVAKWRIVTPPWSCSVQPICFFDKMAYGKRRWMDLTTRNLFAMFNYIDYVRKLLSLP